MAVYYNEIDPYAAQWIRNLIDAGHIAPGVVDERSIVDVKPIDLAGFSQCHFFAGIGVWGLALRRAGWPDDKPIWTGSCPCQPFSSAGKGNGFDDERHLWPHFQWLIQQCKPPVVIGEQVASKDTNPWIDLVHADLEAMGYAFGCVAFPSASVGAPHIRDRAYWVANSEGIGRADGTSITRGGRSISETPQPQLRAGDRRTVMRMADMQIIGCERECLRTESGLPEVRTENIGSARRLANTNSTGLSADAIGEFHHTKHNAESCGGVIGMGNSANFRDKKRNTGAMGGEEFEVNSQAREGHGEANRTASADVHNELPGPVNGLWRSADWLHCRDGKWRPVEPGTFPLVNGAANRVGRLRAYGNAINAYQAQIFIESVMDII